MNFLLEDQGKGSVQKSGLGTLIKHHRPNFGVSDQQIRVIYQDSILVYHHFDTPPILH